MEQKKKLIFGLIITILVLSGITFALWPTARVQKTTNVVNTSCFATTFIEKTSAINLDNAYPITDAEGKQLDPYIFTITNTCTADARYAINLDIDEQTTISLDNIKVEINEEYPLALTDYIVTTPTITNATHSYMLTTGTLSAASAKNASDGGKATYELRMWLDEAMTTAEATAIFMAKIVVTTIAEATEKELIASADISKTSEDHVIYEYYSDGSLIIKGTGAAEIPIEDDFVFLYQVYQAYVANNEEFSNNLTEAEKNAIIPSNYILMMPVITGCYKSLTNFLKAFNVFLEASPTNYTEYITELQKEAPNLTFTIIDESFFSLAAKIKESFPGFKSVKVEEGITILGKGLLNFISSDSISLPSTLTTIDEGAFGFSQVTIDLSNCSQLTAINREAFLSSYIKEFTWPIDSHVITLANRVFAAANITEMILPNSITNIDTEIFSHANIGKLVIPENATLTTLPYYFLSNAMVAEVIIPENIIIINPQAFKNINTDVSLKFKGAERDLGTGSGSIFDLSPYNVTWNYTE